MAEPGRQPPPPPPPPPPPTAVAPIVFSTPKLLASSQRPSANRQHVGGVSAAQSPQRHPFAGVHPETLQHAAASLRKTQYREPLLAREIDTLGGGPNELPDRRHWADCAQHAPLAEHSSGTAIHASSAGAAQSRPFRVDVQHTDPLTVRINYNNDNKNYSGGNSNTFITTPNFSSYSTYRTAQLNNNNNGYTTTTRTTHNDHNNNNNNIGASNTVTRQIPINRTPATPSQFQPHYGANTNDYGVSVDGQNISQSSYHTTTKSTTTTSSANRFGDDVVPSSTTPISDPQARIRDYATNTPAASLIPQQQQQQQQQQAGLSSSTSAGPGSSTVGHDFVRELRDSSLTERQKYSNQFQKSLLDSDRPPVDANLRSVSSLRPSQSSQLTAAAGGAYASVDALITDMERRLRAGDVCTKCGQQIIGDTPGVTALGNAFHVTCFTCDVCRKQLAGCSFYSVDGQNLCQVDYMNSLEKCEKCATPITQKILRAMGKAFHPECFTCPACGKSLDGIPFTVDKQNQAFCLECYHERFSPRCAACLKAIAPIGNETEVARVIAMDRSYHIDCYKCEDCGLRLNSKVEGQGCYPLESHLLCKNCNLKRLKNTYQPSTATA